MLRIACDLDGVVYEWDKTARYMLRRKLGRERRPIPTELFMPSRHWNAIKDAVAPEDWRWLWNEGVDLGLFRYGHCVTGAIEGVEALGNMGQLYLVTARPHRSIADTSDWVRFMFNRAQIADLVFSQSDSKSTVEADVYVDDAPHNVQDLTMRGCGVIVFRRPWNNEIPESTGLHVYNWQGIVDTVEGMLP